MPFTLTMPKLSPTMEEGTLVKWHKKEGDAVESGELLFEVATDKATVEYNALDEGYLRKIIVQEGSEAKVNQPVAVFSESADESLEGYVTDGEKASAQEAQKNAQPAKQEAASEQADQAQKVESGKAKESSQKQEGEGRILASPLAKKLAKEKNIDLAAVKGSGPNQRVMSRDLAIASSPTVKDDGKVAKSQEFDLTSPQLEPMGSFTEETLSQMRKVIAKRLQEAKATIPHIYIESTVNAEQLVNFRNQLSDLDLKVSVNDCIIKATALALKKHPEINSGFNNANNTIIRFKTVDISVAVSIKEGLITPIIRYADYKSLEQISKEIRELAGRAKIGKLKLEEFQGGSFSVSNLGMFGVTNFQAIVNPPQAAILSVSAIQNVPVVKDGKIVPGKQFHINLSCDHRVIDGAAGAIFMQTLKGLLENPLALLL